MKKNLSIITLVLKNYSEVILKRLFKLTQELLIVKLYIILTIMKNKIFKNKII